MPHFSSSTDSTVLEDQCDLAVTVRPTAEKIRSNLQPNSTRDQL